MKKTEAKVCSSECARYLGLPHIGKKILLSQPTALESNEPGSLKFFTKTTMGNYNFLNKSNEAFYVLHADLELGIDVPHVKSNNPRLDYCKLLNKFFKLDKISGIEESAAIGKNVQIEEGVYIGHNVVIGADTRIGSNTRILHNVVIAEKTTIGHDCLIKSGTVIGQKGFGFERDYDGKPMEFVHYGKVTIGNWVEIGALNTIAQGVFTETIISDGVKTDDQVHIAHNVHVGNSSLIVDQAAINGSVVIGKNVWVGPNSTIIDGVTIGDGVFIGMGAVVIKGVEENSTMIGNPAHKLR